MLSFFVVISFLFNFVAAANLRSTGLPVKNDVYETDKGFLFQFVQDPWHPRKGNALALLVASPLPAQLSNTSHLCETFRVNKFEGQNRIMLDSGQVFDIEMHRKKGYYVLRHDIYKYLNLTATSQIPQCIPTLPASSAFPVPVHQSFSSFVPSLSGTEFVLQLELYSGVYEHQHYDANNGSLLYTDPVPEAPTDGDSYLGWDGIQHWWYHVTQNNNYPSDDHNDNTPAHDDHSPGGFYVDDHSQIDEFDSFATITSQSGTTVEIAECIPAAVSKLMFVCHARDGATALFNKDGSLRAVLPVLQASPYNDISYGGIFLARDESCAFTVANLGTRQHPLKTNGREGIYQTIQPNSQPVVLKVDILTGSVLAMRALPSGVFTSPLWVWQGGYFLNAQEFVLSTTVFGLEKGEVAIRKYRW